jgi:imidazolonepropionase
LARDDVGRLAPGTRGDLVLLDGDHWVDLAYHPGMDVVAHVVKDGEVVR